MNQTKIMGDLWKPEQYARFAHERAQPFWDLLALVQGGALKSCVDLGCGTGEWTAALHQKLRLQNTLGLDSSLNMLEKSQEHQVPGLLFQLGSIEEYRAGSPVDLLFSNAALHWVENHRKLFPELLAQIAKGGQVAVQMPYNHDHLSHRAADSCAERLFGQKVRLRQMPLLPIEDYALILHRAGFCKQNVFVKVYLHSFTSGEEVVQWTKGTLLTHFEQQLSADEFSRFLEAYRAAILAESGSGPYIYSFKRLFIWGQSNG